MGPTGKKDATGFLCAKRCNGLQRPSVVYGHPITVPGRYPYLFTAGREFHVQNRFPGLQSADNFMGL